MHNEYKRIVEKSNIAVIFIHGILGTPNHFDMLLSLVPEHISIYNVLLDGHGKGVKEFSKTSMKKWEEQIEGIVNELCLTHEEIYIVAHSMGCLLALEQSVKNSKISKMFLISPPLKLFLKPQMFVNSLKVYIDKINENDKVALAAKRCCGISHHKNPFKYFGWIPRFLELFSKIKQTRGILNKVSVPCSVYLSCKDEMVSLSSQKFIKDNSNFLITQLKKSGHFYYEESDLELLKNDFISFISQKFE